ncbi:MAG: hypothetical protein JO002_01245 [Burkholderiaceae bacterium]|nr:hypothetical protein [Burkholderiaceae bacterium]
MSNPQSQGIPGMGAMSDTLDFVKNLWGGMGMSGMKIPGMIMPTLSVEEINKQIADLKTVESWLTLNMNMLRSTIQALEVQSATISTLQAMGDSLSAAVTPMAKADAPVKTAAKAPEPEPEPRVEPIPDPAVGSAKAAQAEVPPMPNPAMWWNMLQDQFKQAVGNAMAAEPLAAAKSAKPAKSPEAKPTARPRKSAASKAAAKGAPKAAGAKAPRGAKTT